MQPYIIMFVICAYFFVLWFGEVLSGTDPYGLWRTAIQLQYVSLHNLIAVAQFQADISYAFLFSKYSLLFNHL